MEQGAAGPSRETPEQAARAEREVRAQTCDTCKGAEACRRYQGLKYDGDSHECIWSPSQYVPADAAHDGKAAQRARIIARFSAARGDSPNTPAEVAPAPQRSGENKVRAETREERVVCHAACVRILRTMRRARAEGRYAPWVWAYHEHVAHHLRRAALHAVEAATAEAEIRHTTHPGDDVDHALTRLAFAAVAGDPALSWVYDDIDRDYRPMPEDLSRFATLTPSIDGLLAELRSMRARLDYCERSLRRDAGEESFAQYKREVVGATPVHPNPSRDLLRLVLRWADAEALKAANLKVSSAELFAQQASEALAEEVGRRATEYAESQKGSR